LERGRGEVCGEGQGRGEKNQKKSPYYLFIKKITFTFAAIYNK
jgi:hypothetical protein